MKILYITQYFYPEIGATTNRALANVRYFANKGHDVTVLTEMPNHPKGIIFNGYKHKIFVKEKKDNFLVNRVWVFTSERKTFITRILFYVSFMFMGFLHTLFSWRKYDIVYVSSPPLFVGVIGLWLKKIFKKTKFVFEVRDLWPDSAIEIGELKSRKAIKISLRLEKQFYENAEKIIAISQHMKNKIIAKGFSAEKILVIYNGTDTDFIENERKISGQFLRKYKKNNKFTVVYAGILGLAQGMQVLFNAADKLRNEPIQFNIIGIGPKELELKEKREKLNLHNLHFIGEINRNIIHEYLLASDCGVIPLRNLELFKGALPSKIFDYMACGLPILIGIDGEAKNIIEDSNAGLFFKPENADDLTKKILWMKNHPKERIEMGKRGRKFVEKYYIREKQAEILEKELLKLLEK